MTTPAIEYLLGINLAELERLRFQHGVWAEVTNAFLNRLKIPKGAKCLDVGSGPGLVALDMADRTGPDGEITLLEPAAYYLEWFRENEADTSLADFICIEGTVESANLPENHYDVIFVRWVINFVPEPEAFLAKLCKSLKTGGILALMDYYYEGLSLFPKGGAFDEMPDIMRSYYHSGGGDPYFTGRIPALFRQAGLELEEFRPNSIAGGPDRPIYEWGHRFFSLHIPIMAERKLISQEKADALLADWDAHRKNPDALFFPPNVMSISGRKISQ